MGDGSHTGRHSPWDVARTTCTEDRGRRSRGNVLHVAALYRRLSRGGCPFVFFGDAGAPPKPDQPVKSGLNGVSLDLGEDLFSVVREELAAAYGQPASEDRPGGRGVVVETALRAFPSTQIRLAAVTIPPYANKPLQRSVSVTYEPRRPSIF